MRGMDVAGVVLIAVMMLGPLALAPAYGPYVEPGTASNVDEATTPLEEGSTPDEASAPTDDAVPG
ncbi:MAG: hypothetical protein H7124_11510 [Phycisphaerales bacterium]|nr:hypothetical protein [Hyphomonadaceae bacterium]